MMAARFIRPDTAFANAPAGKLKKRPRDTDRAHLDWTDRLFDDRPGAIRIACSSCSRMMYIPPSKKGQRAHCSIECKTSSPPQRVEQWGKRIWEKRDGTVQRACEGCRRVMHLPPSKANRQFCSLDCKKAATQVRLTKQCESCGKSYIARKEDQRFCSQACNPATKRISSAENLARAQEGKRKAIADGRISFPSGPDNSRWKGGPEALRRRQIDSGKSAQWCRLYRKNNPDKVREFSARRAHRKLGKLPYGTIPRIRDAQRGKCAICRLSLRGKYHVDHIQPLARGGQHVAGNIQLLCAPCNLAKSSRDPIAHMQSLGRLL